MAPTNRKAHCHLGSLRLSLGSQPWSSPRFLLLICSDQWGHFCLFPPRRCPLPPAHGVMGQSTLGSEHKGTQAMPSLWAGPCLCSKTEPPVLGLCVQQSQGRNKRLAKRRTLGSLTSGHARKCM